jgi:hypothetical protein
MRLVIWKNKRRDDIFITDGFRYYILARDGKLCLYTRDEINYGYSNLTDYLVPVE